MFKMVYYFYFKLINTYFKFLISNSNKVNIDR